MHPTYYETPQELAGLARLEIGPEAARLYMPTRRADAAPPPLSGLAKTHCRKFWEELRSEPQGWTLHLDALAAWLVGPSGQGGLLLPASQFARLPATDPQRATRLEVYSSRRGRVRLTLTRPLAIRGI